MTIIKKIANYNCRYIHDTQRPVYTILKERKFIHQSEFFTTAFYNNSAKDSSNALLAFDCPNVARVGATTSSHKDSSVMEFNMKELIDYSSMIKLPFVVVLSMYCNIDEQDECYEIYYQDVRNKAMDLAPPSDYPDHS